MHLEFNKSVRAILLYTVSRFSVRSHIKYQNIETTTLLAFTHYIINTCTSNRLLFI